MEPWRHFGAIRGCLQVPLNRLGREPAIRTLAIDSGLGQLSDPIVLPAR